MLTEIVPVLGTVAVFRSHLYSYFLDEMERLNQSKHVPSVLLTLFRCPMCVGLHAAWIWKLCINPSDFNNLSTAGYVLGCSLTSLAGHYLLEILGRLTAVLELTEGTLLNTLPKAVTVDTEPETKLEGD